jgi:hypothetical protein
MMRNPVMPWLLPMVALAAGDHPDLLRFTNGDQIHGAFLGIKDGPRAVWQRDDLSAPVDFKTTRIRHVVLHGGRPRKPPVTLSHIELVNGDRIPGAIIGMDAETVILDTSCAGTLRVPRSRVSMLAPNPMGGRVHYHGPFTEEDWKMAQVSFPDGPPPASGQAGRWAFSGSAWHWPGGQAGTALVRESGLPERAVLRFDLAWKNRLNIALAFHADFARSEPAGDDEKRDAKARAFAPVDSSDLPRLFGNSHVLQIYSNFLMLFRTSVSVDAKPSCERVQVNSNHSVRLGESGRAIIEVRANRASGAISLFVNDEFAAQWSGGDAPPGAGGGFGFVVLGDDSPVRLSDIVVSEWNGMPDSARSLRVDDQDVVLMTNGTDRFAGKAGVLDARGRILFEGKHGQLQFPLEDAAEIRFARDRLAAVADAPGDGVLVRMAPIGLISGRPLAGDGATLGILSPILGELNLSLDSAVMLDFNSSNQIIDAWDADF